MPVLSALEKHFYHLPITQLSLWHPLIWPPLILAVLTLISWVLRPQSRILGVLFPTQKLS
jgi:hypothetical protein